jgi:hypothetical protein
LALKISAPLLALVLGVPSTAAVEQPMIGQQAPGFDLPTLDGESLSLADFRGKLVVLHFGAGW